MLDVITCANFGVEKLRCLGNTRGQIFEFPIEMAGHLYNRAGVTAQPVICFSCLGIEYLIMRGTLNLFMVVRSSRMQLKMRLRPMLWYGPYWGAYSTPQTPLLD